MGQVTIYLDDSVHEKMKTAAKASKISVSKWVAGIIKEKMATEWPEDVIALAGSWSDDDFPAIEEIRSNDGQDVPREAW
jgi:hypothetical protein